MKRWATLAVAASVLLIAACGSESDDTKTSGTGPLSNEQACAEARVVQADQQRLTDDLKAGKADMGRMMKEMETTADRLEAVVGRVPPGQTQDAIRQWAATSKAQLDNPTDENQDATYNARDKVDDLCGIPRGSRL